MIFPARHAARVLRLVENHDDVHERHARETNQSDVVEVVKDLLKLSVVAHDFHDLIEREILVLGHDQRLLLASQYFLV